tara:strand:- start:2064 stop:2231 length:168 start_codon:yes stop_codon:yes gene_type:complete
VVWFDFMKSQIAICYYLKDQKNAKLIRYAEQHKRQRVFAFHKKLGFGLWGLATLN